MGTPARAQYEAQEFSGEVLDRFSTHILKPLPAEEEMGLVESYAQQQGLAIDRPVLKALQKALYSLRDSYRQGLLPVPPSVQSLFRVVSRLGRFPDTKGDIVQTFGLRDMFGNVWEWMQDKHEGSYAGAPTDGSAFDGAGSFRVIRGGSWNFDVRSLRSAYRNFDDPGVRWDSIGARLVRSRR